MDIDQLIQLLQKLEKARMDFIVYGNSILELNSQEYNEFKKLLQECHPEIQIKVVDKESL